jgi:hypothetical protein
MGKASKRYVLLHWPRSSWRVPRHMSAGMTEELGEAIRTAIAAEIHVALVDGDNLALTCDGIVADLSDPVDLTRALAHLASGGALNGTRDTRTIILCCTDSKQDACCARYGFATYKALLAEADQTRFRILQATHLGGCRFAASLVVLPARHRYGRIEPGHVPQFLQSLEAGKPFLANYRGSNSLSEAQQVAEHAALSWAAAEKFDGEPELTNIDGNVDDAEGAEIHTIASFKDRKLALHLRRMRFPVNTRCKTLSDERTPQTVLRWVIRSEVSDPG